MSFLLVLSTAPSHKEARALAVRILQKKLAACINLLPAIESHYWWKGKRVRGKEVLLFIKTKTSAYPSLEKLIRRSHSYSVPEILAIPIKKGNPAYLSWLQEEIR